MLGMMRKDSRKHQGSIYFKEGGLNSMKLRKMMLNINGVDRMFMCDPENDKLSDVLRGSVDPVLRLDVEPVSAVHVPSF